MSDELFSYSINLEHVYVDIMFFQLNLEAHSQLVEILFKKFQN